jgi:manganese/zinc/iron transport system permease protein
MHILEQLIVDILLRVASAEQINTVLGDPRTVAILVGGLVAISGAWLGTFLLLRKMSLTSDAISHTVLLGIVVAFIVMANLLGLQPSLSSPWLIIGAAVAGVATVMLTELIFRSGLVKADAALGLAFPFLFAIAIILISSSVDNVHLDEDAVMVGEIGIAWANANSFCYANCDDVTITPDDPRMEVGRRCTNCAPGEVSPRSPEAVFEEYCANCGTYTAAEAWRDRLITEPPTLVFWPRSLTVLALITLINLGFITLFYKELKLSTFDSALAAALGFRPGMLNYLLMMLVSVTAVGAFDAVGSILVVAFFIVPAATAYLLTDRLSVMLVLSPALGGLSAITGYDLARGQFLSLIDMNRLMRSFYNVFGWGEYITWNTSISASMVIMAFVFFIGAWILSPRYGLVSTLLRRRMQRQQFAVQMLLGHIYNHEDSPDAATELAVSTLHEHMNWPADRTQRVINRVQMRSLVRVENQIVRLTDRGREQVARFIRENLSARIQ